jgi:hypothetical protein
MADEEITDIQAEAIDPDHPFVQASMAMDPTPQNVAFKFEAMELEVDGRTMPVAQGVIVTNSTAMVIYLSPKQLAALLLNGGKVLETFREAIEEQKSGLIVATPEEVQAVTKSKKGKKS